MNREIKFRGKRIDNNEWIKGQLLFFKDSVGKDNMTRIAGGCEWNNETDWYNLCDIHRVKEDTIGQFTGLKDKNGNEIYEGDILKLPVWLKQDDENEKCICIYDEQHQTSEIIGFGLYMKNAYSKKYQDLVPSDEWDEFEVVGNIYDNPELLKGEQS